MIKKIKILFLHHLEVLGDERTRNIQTKYFSKLTSEPKSDFERSLLQYKCQNFSRNKLLLLAIHILALMFLVVIISIVSVTTVLFYRKSKPKKQYCHCVWNVDKSLIPSQYKNLIFINNINLADTLLTVRFIDISYIMKLSIQSHLRGLFVLKVFYKVLHYRYMIEKYNPASIIVISEYSYTSSVMTAYCELLNIQHINVMHGEKLFNMRDSYFRFSTCWVWDDYYIGLFKALRAESEQFQLYNPFEDFCLTKGSSLRLTYYLQRETVPELLLLRDILRKVNNYTIVIRPHPGYSDAETIRNIFSDYEIETNIDIKESLASASLVCSKYSTVLQIASSNDIDIMIDDLSNKEQYRALCFYKYKFTNVDVMKLSKFMEQYSESTT